MKRMRKTSVRRISTLAALLVAGGIVVLATGLVWVNRHDLIRTWERATLPPPMSYQETSRSVVTSPVPTLPLASSEPIATSDPSSAPLPSEVNLAVPFTVQAPYAKWEAPYNEFCEEASTLMAISYFRGETILSPEAADQQMLASKAFAEQTFGYYEDTTAAETAVIVRDFYHYNDVELKENPSVDDIKEALAAGKLVIVPVAGQQLGNPYFQQPGPLYHMLVIKGYTTDAQFITNDPGTRRGADFLYDEAVIMAAIHDWRADRQIQLGRKVILILG